MKKISILLASAAVLSLTFTSCGEKKVDKLKTSKDTLSYAYGVSCADQIVENYLKGDSAGENYDQIIKGLKDGMKSKDSSTTYYAMGLSIGSTLRQNAEKGFMNDSTMSFDFEIMRSAFFSALARKDKLLIDKQAANNYLQGLANKGRAKQMMKQFGANKQANDAFMAKNKTQAGVKTTPSGLQYQVLKEGNGAKPTANQKVKINYIGKLINGKEFDNSYKRGQAAVFPVGSVIKGFGEGLQLMSIGSKYRLFIPQELAYGANSQNPIPPFSALIFDVELISIEN